MGVLEAGWWRPFKVDEPAVSMVGLFLGCREDLQLCQPKVSLRLVWVCRGVKYGRVN